MLKNALVVFIAELLITIVFWTLLGWILGRYAGRPGKYVFVAIALFGAMNVVGSPETLALLRDTIGLLPLLLSMGAGALVCLDSARRRERLRPGTQGRP